MPCINDCATCSDATTCKTCVDLTYLLVTTCVSSANCGTGKYGEDSTNRCT